MQPLATGRPVVVVGHGKEQVQAALAGQADFVEQAEQRGTGHAVSAGGVVFVDGVDAVLVSYGDMPRAAPKRWRNC